MSLANFFQGLFPSEKTVEEDISHPAGVAQKTYDTYRFSSFLPILSYRAEDSLYRCRDENDGDDEFACIFEIQPRVTMGDKTAAFMQELIEKLPVGMYLQVHYIGSKNIKSIIDGFEQFHDHANPLFQKAMKNFSAFLYQKTQENITHSFNAYLKSPRVLISARGQKRDEVGEFGSAIFNTANSNMFYPKYLSPEELKPIFWELCNGEIDFLNIPPYDKKAPFGRQCVAKSTQTKVHDNSFSQNGKHWIAMAPVSYPEEACIDDFGLKLGDFLSTSSNLNQFKDTFLITTSYRRLGRMETAKIGRKQMAIDAQKLPRMFTRLTKKKNEALPVKEKLDERQPCLLFDMTVMVSGKDYKEANQNATTVQSFWNKGGKNSSQIILDRLFAGHHIAFLQSLPAGATDEHFAVTDNYSFNFSDEVSQFLPLEADWRGNTPNALAISRRGVISGFDLFDSPLSKNAYVVATSGAGKSVLLQYISLYNYGCKTTNYIIDIGGSYENVCKGLKGEYIEVDMEKPISFNPFSAIQNAEELEQSMAFLEDFIYMLGASKNLAESEKEEKYIKGYISQYLKELYANFGSTLEITDIKNQFYKQDDDRQKQFAQHLVAFSKGGTYGKFFTGEASISLQNPYTVLELGKVEEMADIRDAIIFVMIFHITQKVYVKNDHSRVQVLIDEAHKFLGKNPKMDSFIDQAYRRFRKHNGSIIIATQGFDDIYNATNGGLSKAGQTIVANSAWKIFLKQTSTSVNLLLGADVFKFTYLEEELIRSISTLKGEYSEFMLITPQEYAITYRLVLDRFFYYLTTTDPADKTKIKNTMEKYQCSIEEAIEILVNFEKVGQKR